MVAVWKSVERFAFYKRSRVVKLAGQKKYKTTEVTRGVEVAGQ